MNKPPYDITSSILDLYGKINERLGQCKGLMLVRPEAQLRRENRIKTIQSSLAIEGNTLEIEQVTAILNNQSVLAPAKDILEVQNANLAYELLPTLKSHSIDDFLRTHHVLLKGLVEEAGKYRSNAVGIMKGTEVKHVAPGSHMVPSLMNNIFDYLRKDNDPPVIKSCVFHYEMEFIHPFQDGNGRMGRFWQTKILMDENRIFEFLPIEAAVKEKQKEYYQALADSDSQEKSTQFIEYMLGRILEVLDGVLSASATKGADYGKRVEFALAQLDGWFDRKTYLEVCKNVSTATASRDLRQMIKDNIVEVSGSARMTRYRKI
ncbi:MAG TPA: cell filamentation protein Fic [Desulfobulbaceae bacterium]|nr:cell filamentation protein Fic [Desulfobulbaceae bacterium]